MAGVDVALLPAKYGKFSPIPKDACGEPGRIDLSRKGEGE